MCGICGWIGNQPTSTPTYIRPMVKALEKRGPDGSRLWSGDGELCVLGHTRLSIIDVEHSTQPMTNEDGTVVVAYNGEIYNFIDLRRRLLAKGHTFRTRGDTEVLVHLYEEYGRNMVQYLDGMFAFGIYDSRRHNLLLARDRIGIKPLYYWHNPATGELLFSTDMGSMLANPQVPRRLNMKALAQYLHFGYIVHPESWLDQVYQLEPGQAAVWHDGRIEKYKYYRWVYEPRENLANSYSAVSELRQTLSASVTSHLIADVPVGSFLSGGLDASTVTGFAQRARQRTGEAIRSFTVRFWVPELDESERARAIACDLGTQHTEIDAKELPFDRQFIERLIDGLGEPFGDTSALAVFVLCEQARPHVKVALSGDGGDELFLGYKGLLKQRLARRLRYAPALSRQMAARIVGGQADVPRRFNKYLRLSLLDDAGLIIEWCRRWEWSQLEALLSIDMTRQLFPSRVDLFPEIRDLIRGSEDGGFLEQQARFHMLVDLPCDMLFKVDRMSMAHGLEVRVPILANDMLEYGRHLPMSARSRKGRTKEPLRTLAETLSPTVATPSSKHGFAFPLDLWMREKLGEYWQEWDLTSSLADIGMQGDEVNRLVTSYSSVGPVTQNYNTGSLSGRLFDLMLLAIWLNRYSVKA